MNAYTMAKQVEERWDGITTVSAAVGIVVVTTTGLVTGQLGPEVVAFVVAALSGIGGYSMHNIVRRGSE